MVVYTPTAPEIDQKPCLLGTGSRLKHTPTERASVAQNQRICKHLSTDHSMGEAKVWQVGACPQSELVKQMPGFHA